jgi:hypothetical protein
MYAAFPPSDYYGHTDCQHGHRRISELFPPPYLSLSLPFHVGSPMFPSTDATRALRWRLSEATYTAYRGSWAEHRVSQVSLCHPLIVQDDLGVSDELCQHQRPAHCPIGQGIEAGVSFPVGRNPLRVHSPCDPAAKPGILAACLRLTRTFQGHAPHRDRVSCPAEPQRLTDSLIEPVGFFIHSISTPRGARQNRLTGSGELRLHCDTA